MNFAEELRRAVPFEIPDRTVDVLGRHFALLQLWNARINLTAVRDPFEAVNRHYAECMVFARLVMDRSPERCTVLDVGSGAGFPGFVIAALWPEAEVTLIESHQRKAVFLSEAARLVQNVRVQGGRAEQLHINADWIVSRAVDPATVISLPYGKRFALLIGSSDIPPGWESVPLSGESRVAAFSVPRGT